MVAQQHLGDTADVVVAARAHDDGIAGKRRRLGHMGTRGGRSRRRSGGRLGESRRARLCGGRPDSGRSRLLHGNRALGRRGGRSRCGLRSGTGCRIGGDTLTQTLGIGLLGSARTRSAARRAGIVARHHLDALVVDGPPRSRRVTCGLGRSATSGGTLDDAEAALRAGASRRAHDRPVGTTLACMLLHKGVCLGMGVGVGVGGQEGARVVHELEVADALRPAALAKAALELLLNGLLIVLLVGLEVI